MSILDDAIREHLELKRAHGADEAELKKLEDEAFGPPRRPDESSPFEEAPTEFLGVAEGGEEPPAEDAPSGRRAANVADLQEAPAPAEQRDEQPPPAADESPAAEEEQPAGEHEAVQPLVAGEEPDESEGPLLEEPSHTTEEREAIAEQPTEFFDVEAEIGEGDSGEIEVEEAERAPEPPSDEGEDDEFFSEQRLSEELDQALEAPLAAEEAGEDEPKGEGEDPVTPDYEPESADHDDVLEDTPDFLEDAPEADDAWFEQRPPKDFDFDD